MSREIDDELAVRRFQVAAMLVRGDARRQCLVVDGGQLHLEIHVRRRAENARFEVFTDGDLAVVGDDVGAPKTRQRKRELTRERRDPEGRSPRCLEICRWTSEEPDRGLHAQRLACHIDDGAGPVQSLGWRLPLGTMGRCRASSSNAALRRGELHEASVLEPDEATQELRCALRAARRRERCQATRASAGGNCVRKRSLEPRLEPDEPRCVRWRGRPEFHQGPHDDGAIEAHGGAPEGCRRGERGCGPKRQARAFELEALHGRPRDQLHACREITELHVERLGAAAHRDEQAARALEVVRSLLGFAPRCARARR